MSKRKQVKKVVEGPPYTYTGIFFVVSEKPGKVFTSKHVIKLCRLLEESFGDGYEFRPEQITEGGLKVTKWPGMKEGNYKTLRFFPEPSFFEEKDWPILYDDTFEKWDTGEEIPIFIPKEDKIFKMRLHLKAFHEAPCWTELEVQKIECAFGNMGFFRTGEFPTHEDLMSHGELGLSYSDYKRWWSRTWGRPSQNTTMKTNTGGNK